MAHENMEQPWWGLCTRLPGDSYCRRFGSLLPRPSLYRRTCDDRRLLLTPSLPQPVRFPGSNVHTYTLANSMFDGPITNLLLILSILIEVLPGTHAAGGGGVGGGVEP